MPTQPKKSDVPGPTMIEAYFIKKVAKPFDWVVLGVGDKPATYRMEVVGVEDGVLHMGVHRLTIENYTGKKVDPRQLEDVSLALPGKTGRDEILDRIAVIADQSDLTCYGTLATPRLLEILAATGLDHLAHRHAA